MENLYGTTQLRSLEEMAKSNEILEMLFVDDIMRCNEEQIKEFCESEEAKILVEKAVLRKPTLIRLSKQDDYKRRIKLMAYQLAKEANDPEWTKLKNFTVKRKACIAKIMTKYGPKAERLAKLGQKEYIAAASKAKSATKDKK